MDLMTMGVSLAKDEPYRKFSKYRPPSRFLQLFRLKAKRQKLDSFLVKASKKLHCSKGETQREYMFLFNVLKKKDKKGFASYLDLTDDELKAV